MAVQPVIARRQLCLGAAAALFAWGVTRLRADDQSARGLTYFRIGAGPLGGVYFPVAGLLAAVISNPPGGPGCGRGGGCGVPGLMAMAQTSAGSVENVTRIAAGEVEAGLVQADIAYWAYHGEEAFAGRAPMTQLRAVANLYSEALHVIVAAASGIRAVDELRGRRVAMGETGSGTLVGATLALEAFGLAAADITPLLVGPETGMRMLGAGAADAVMLIAGHPAPAVAAHARVMALRLLPVDGAAAEALLARTPFFHRDRVPAGDYDGVDNTPTLSVGAQLVVSADLDADLVYELTRALWRPSNRATLNAGHPLGRRITLETALDGVAIPLHRGAAAYYQERLGDAMPATPRPN